MKTEILHSFFLNFVPMTKRAFFLLFKKKNYPIVTILNKTDTKKNIQSFIYLELELMNVLFLKINDNVCPIFHDNTSLKITLPIEGLSSEIELIAYGLFKSKKENINSLSSSKLFVKSILFDRLGRIADKKLTIVSPTINEIKKPLNISNLSAPVLSESLEINNKKYRINYKHNVLVNLDLTDLEFQLKMN